jgi:hypothetical protein
MSDKPLDILAAQTEATVDPVDAAFAGMFDAASEFFAATATCAAKFSYGSAHVGMSAIRAKFLSDPRLVAVETLIQVFSTQWPQLSSSPLPPIYDNAQPAPTVNGVA